MVTMQPWQSQQRIAGAMGAMRKNYTNEPDSNDTLESELNYSFYRFEMSREASTTSVFFVA